MGHPLTEYARAWLFGWSEVSGDPAAVRPAELTPQMMREAWSLRKQMRANAHHITAQRLSLSAASTSSPPSNYGELLRYATTRYAFSDVAEKIRLIRDLEGADPGSLPRIRTRAKRYRARLITGRWPKRDDVTSMFDEIYCEKP